MANASTSSEAPPVHESRLYETVRLIREWIEGSFDPAQEQRFQWNGNRLKAKFDVDLGNEMREQLQAYISASFALSKLLLRFTEREKSGGRAPRPCVEVLLTEEARTIYRQKHPEAVARAARRHLPLDDGERSGMSAPVALADRELRPALVDAPKTAAASLDFAPAVVRPAANKNDGRVRIEGADAPAASGKAAMRKGIDGKLHPAPPLKRRKEVGDVKVESPRSKHAAQVDAVRAAAPASIWEAVAPREVMPAVEGLREAKDGLELGLHVKGGLAAIKAEKDAVAWLKGLQCREVTITELKETLIGQTVNSWRKHQDDYVSGLAFSLLKSWKGAYRDGRTAEAATTAESVRDAAAVAAESKGLRSFS